MGVRGLAKRIKETDGIQASSLQKKEVHVDFLAMFFGLVRDSCFRDLSNTIAKEYRSTNIVTTTTEDPTEIPYTQHTAKGGKRQATEEYPQRKKPRASVTGDAPTPQSCKMHGAAQRISRILAKYMDKESTVLHIDGQPSIQKSGERRERNKVLNKKIDSLEKEVNGLGKKRLGSLFSRIKQAYRVPPKSVDELGSRLEDLGWQVCHCPYQADSHIASIVKDSPEKDDIAIVTTDSDLLVYQGITSVTMPVGKSRELMTFDKAAVLEHLDLQSDFELLLVAILSTNDYSKALPWYGIERNAEAVRALRPFINSLNAEDSPDVLVQSVIKEYLKAVRGGSQKSVQDYEFAIDAFALIDEQLDASHPSSSDNHERITALLRKLEDIKVQRRKHGHAGQPQSLSAKNKKKYEKWRRSSPNLDRNPRFNAHLLKDVTKASPVDETEIRKMAIEKPRARKLKELHDTITTNAEQNQECIEQPTELPPTMDVDIPEDEDEEPQQFEKQQQPKKNQHQKEQHTKAKKTLEKSKKQQAAGANKKPEKGTIRRATSMSQDEARAVAERINSAVHTMSMARIMVFKGIELLVYKHLSDKSHSSNMAMDLDEQESTSKDPPIISIEDTSMKESDLPMNPLDLLLDRKHGRTLVRNLSALVMNGKIDRGRTSNDPCGKQARELAKSTYEDLSQVVPGVLPLTPESYKDMHLAVPNADICVNMHTAIRSHFRRLPELITAKMSKLRWPQGTIPNISEKDSMDETSDMNLDDKLDVDDEEETTSAPEDDAKLSFEAGYIAKWWNQYMRLPPEVRPVFVPSAGFKDTFQDLSESALLGILWGDKKAGSSHPTKAIMERHIFSYEDADNAIKKNYGSILFKLFVGLKDEIRKDNKKQQTSYGKRCHTMETLSSKVPEFDGQSLQQYLADHFAYLKAWKAAKASGSTTSLSHPKLPSSNDGTLRYALSNRIRTDGMQLHITAFDTRRQWSGKKAPYMPSLEKRLPDRQTIIGDVGPIEDIVVVGVDPGEKVSATFCMLDPKSPAQVSNLMVKRNALYGPVLGYRNRMDDIKRCKPGGSELPSIKEIEGSLGDSSFTSLDHHISTLENFAGAFRILTEFYSSKTAKKFQWEKSKSLQAEKDLAFNGAMRMVPKGGDGKRRPALFIYGDGQFNTKTKLTTLHTTFKNYFFMKVTISYPSTVKFILGTVDRSRSLLKDFVARHRHWVSSSHTLTSI
ncbi:hypothetical protein B0O80DRAFT_275249 [Mortierella sp. GBAus27b]|nr:hypothetical protein B0O80DRAFT_275249 [Mortierella sp. GBAus27b]